MYQFQDLAIHLQEHRCWVLLTPAIQTVLHKYRQLGPFDHEAGGILLGFRRGEIDLELTLATEPTPKDKRGMFSFFRSTWHHQDVARQQWMKSGGTVDYLGDWHTHPEDHPTPSSTDRREWEKLRRNSPRPLIFIIVGRVDIYLEGPDKKGHRFLLSNSIL